MTTAADRLLPRLTRASFSRVWGHVTRVVGLAIEGACPDVPVGATCFIETGDRRVPAEVVALHETRIVLMPYGDVQGIAKGNRILVVGPTSEVDVGPEVLGRIVNGLGAPIDGLGAIETAARVPVYGPAPDPLTRRRIVEPLDLGVRAVNGLLTCGKGQRLGIFAGSGVGKSTLLGMMARFTEADVNVIALVGERGRELREFLERDLGPEGLRRSVVVVATSDQPPLIRARAAYVATAYAEYFRRAGKNVLFLGDSLTRWAMAQREIGLASGEPPTARGYTPSVFARLPALLERTGNDDGPGSCTAIYTVLVEGDDMNEPIADATRSILDGHIVLSRSIASRGQFPSIDVGPSISRVMDDLTTVEHRSQARRLRQLLGAWNEAEDLIQLGAYVPGRDAALDEAVQKIGRIRQFLSQGRDEKTSLPETLQALGRALA